MQKYKKFYGKMTKNIAKKKKEVERRNYKLRNLRETSTNTMYEYCLDPYLSKPTVKMNLCDN
jgi:hypothetical protein